MTYNILVGGRGREEQLRAVIAAARPDVLVINEANDARVITWLAGQLDMQALLSPVAAWRSTAVLTRLPVLRHAVLQRPPFTRPPVDVTLAEPSGAQLRIFAVHLFPAYAWFAELTRVLEVDALLAYIRAAAPGPHLIVGDHNALAPGDGARVREMPRRIRWMIYAQAGRLFHAALAHVLRAGYVDCYRRLHPHEPGLTLPAREPNARLDYIFADARMAARLRACEVVSAPPAAREASDHLPVYADFDDMVETNRPPR